MTIEEAKMRLKRARSYLFAITRELDKIDELWRRLCSPTGPRWSLEYPGTKNDDFKAELFDRLAEREKAAKVLYDYVLVVERELRILAKFFPDEAQVLDMHYIDRYSFKEVAEKLRFSESWVRHLCGKGLRDYAKTTQK